MFIHIFKYRFLCRLRNTTNLFWLLIFPLVLSSLFYAVFSNLLQKEAFQQIPIAVVTNEQKEVGNPSIQEEYLSQAILAVSQGQDALFQVTYVDLNQAQTMLTQEQIVGYLNQGNLVVGKAGIQESIVRSFLQEVHQASTTMEIIGTANPNAMASMVQDIQAQVSFVTNVQENSTNNTVIYFYTIFAMVCFYASFQGIEEIRSTQANFSHEAARIGIAPTNKFISFGAGIAASMVIQCMVLIVLFAYMKGVLRIEFGNQLFHIAFTCVLGSLCGMFFGATLCAIIKTKPGTTETISSAITMFLCFLSGMMGAEIKYAIDYLVPFLRYINPVNLITDSFYSLYYYDTLHRYWLNSGILAMFIVAFALLTYLVLRRQRYASI